MAMPKSAEIIPIAGVSCAHCGAGVDDRIAVSVEEFCRLTSLGRTIAFAMIRDNLVESRLLGRRRVILTRSIKALLDLDATAEKRP